jgi:hypothetical protein
MKLHIARGAERRELQSWRRQACDHDVTERPPRRRRLSLLRSGRPGESVGVIIHRELEDFGSVRGVVWKS